MNHRAPIPLSRQCTEPTPDAKRKSVSFGADAAGGSSLDEHSNGHGAAKDSPSSHDDHGGGHGHHDGPPPGPIMKAMHFAQSYSLPLLLGIVAALIWANIAPESYHNVLGHGHDTWQPFPNFLPFGHALNIHYCINDIFMVFFFGIAAKEVAESALPGGSLNPPRKALAPLVATLGGVGGPVAIYMLTCFLFYSSGPDGGAFSSYTKFVPSANASSSSSAAHRMLGASDYFGASGAVSGGIFGMSSSALLSSSSSSSDDAFTWREQQQQWAHRDRMRWLQSIDDPSQLSDSHNRMLASAAVDYSAGTYERIELGDIIYGWGVPTATDISLAWVVAVQVFPFRHPAIDFLLLLAVADDAIGLVIIAIAYKDENYPTEWVYLLVCVAATLITLFLHKIVRLQHWAWYIILAGIPSWIGLSKARLHPALALVFVVPFLPSKAPNTRPNQIPTLHAFEHAIKMPVDFGLFLFTFANAGVQLSGGGGPLAVAVVAALVVGKLLGVTILVLLAHYTGCAPLNSKIKKGDVMMVASMASIGLTVALFVAGVAFKSNPRLEVRATISVFLHAHHLHTHAFFSLFSAPLLTSPPSSSHPIRARRNSAHCSPG